MPHSIKSGVVVTLGAYEPVVAREAKYPIGQTSVDASFGVMGKHESDEFAGE